MLSKINAIVDRRAHCMIVCDLISDFHTQNIKLTILPEMDC